MFIFCVLVLLAYAYWAGRAAFGFSQAEVIRAVNEVGWKALTALNRIDIQNNECCKINLCGIVQKLFVSSSVISFITEDIDHE